MDEFLLNCTYSNELKYKHLYVKKNSFFKALVENLEGYHELLKPVVKEIHKKGGESYLVGGATRDLIAGFKPKDFDVLVKNFELEELREKLGKIGRLTKHPRIKNHIGLIINETKIDFFIPQKEINGVIKHSKKYTVKEFLSCYDYTINSAAINLKDYELTYLKNTLKDIKNKKLRLIDNNYNLENTKENRFLRAFRFIAKHNLSFEEKTLQFYKKNFKKIMDTFKNEREELKQTITYEIYYTLAGKYAGKAVTILVENEMFDDLIEIYTSYEDWIGENKEYSKNLPDENSFLISDYNIEYGEFSAKGWLAFKSPKNPIVQEIIKRIKELNIRKEYDVYFTGGILQGWHTWDLDIGVCGPYDEEYVRKILRELIKIGFKYHVYIDAYFIKEKFKALEFIPISQFSESDVFTKEVYLYSNHFCYNGIVREDIIENSEKITEGFYYQEYPFPFPKHFKRIREGHRYSPPISIYDL